MHKYTDIYQILLYKIKNGGVLESGNQKRKLKMTYHAGEDFLDLTDGLRAIDEVIRFLWTSQRQQNWTCFSIRFKSIQIL